MSEVSPSQRNPIVWFRNKFLAGLAVAIPLLVTFWILKAIYDFLHELSAPLLRDVATVFNGNDAKSILINVDGPGFKNFTNFIGFLVPIVFVVVLGVVASNVIGARVVLAMDKLMLRIPMISFIYKSLKQVIDAFKTFGGNKGFKRVVYVEYPSQGMRLIGFVTGQFFDEKLQKGMTCVLLPTAPSPMTGLVVVAENDRVVDAGLTMEGAMKMIFSGGLIGPETIEAIQQIRPVEVEVATKELSTTDFIHLPKADDQVDWDGVVSEHETLTK